MVQTLLVFCHGVDEQSEKVFFYDDDSYPAILNLILYFFVDLV